MRVLKKRLDVVEASAGGGGGCGRCRGVLVAVRNATTGDLHSARWNGEAIPEGELLGRRTEEGCPRCGRGLDPGGAPVIGLGGLG